MKLTKWKKELFSAFENVCAFSENEIKYYQYHQRIIPACHSVGSSRLREWILGLSGFPALFYFNMCHLVKILYLNFKGKVLMEDLEWVGEKEWERHRNWEKFMAETDSEWKFRVHG